MKSKTTLVGEKESYLQLMILAYAMLWSHSILLLLMFYTLLKESCKTAYKLSQAFIFSCHF